jgi:hypothetical protein
MSKVVPIFLGLIISAVLLGSAYGIGSFSVLFNTNMCYSEIISLIQEEVDYAIKTNSTDDLIEVQNLMESLPLRGYESDCNEIHEAAKSYNKQRLRTRSAPQL